MSKLVTVEVHTIGVNRADILQLDGKYPAPDGNPTPGLELCGIRLDTNEKVCALVPSGAYAKHLEIDERLIFNIEPHISFINGAALPQAMVTAWLNLCELNYVNNYNNILIHGGGSGVGSLMVQFAAELFQKVYTTAQSLKKLSYCSNIPNCHSLTYENFYETLFANEKLDYIIDIIGGNFFKQNISLLNNNSTMIIFAVMQGKMSEINLAKILMKNIKIIGSTLRQKSTEEKHRLIQAACSKFLPMINSGKVKPIIAKVFDFKDYKKAHEYLKNRQNTGKVILQIK